MTSLEDRLNRDINTATSWVENTRNICNAAEKERQKFDFLVERDCHRITAENLNREQKQMDEAAINRYNHQ